MRHIKTHQIVARLAETLDDPDNIIRAHACRALARTGDRQAIELLRATRALEKDPLVLRVLTYSLKGVSGI